MNTEMVDMLRVIAAGVFLLCIASGAQARNMILSITSENYGPTAVFSDVTTFWFDIEIDADLAAGVYSDPDIVSVTYQVRGDLDDTPSGFRAFDLQRGVDSVLTGTEFYAQGSSLRFEIADSAFLEDGIQVDELVPDGEGVALTLDAREVDTGRYHPPILVLRQDGTGNIQNSNNMGDTKTNPMTGELVDVDYGEEYITDLAFDPGNLTLLTEKPGSFGGYGGGSAMSLYTICLLVLFVLAVRLRRRHPGIIRLREANLVAVTGCGDE